MRKVEDINSSELPQNTRIHIAENYGFNSINMVRRITRGLINRSFIIVADQSEYVVTVFQNKTHQQVEKIVSVMNSLSGIPIAKPLCGEKFFIEIDEKPAIICPFVEGIHAVEEDHSVKSSLPGNTHEAISRLFWEMHTQLKAMQDDKGLLPLKTMTMAEEIAEDIRSSNPSIASDKTLQRLIDICIDGAGPVTSNEDPQIVHSDFERQNILLDTQWLVKAILDFDALKRGDLMYEFAHTFHNFVCCDPSPNADDADIYMEDLCKITTYDEETIYRLICLFCLEDIRGFIEVADNEKEIKLLSIIKHYISSLNFAREYLQP
ncbi:MAG: aminoglycoside phosphotransferase family protein [Candidatus Gracilibacteria bacterium]